MGLQMVGTINTFITDEYGSRKGFGFITGEDAVERFFHRSDCQSGSKFDGMREGDSVDFEHMEGERGARATNVCKR